MRVIQSSPSTQSSTVCAGPPLPLSTCGRPQSAATPGTVNRRAYADACALAIQTADRHADEMLRTHHEQIVDGSSGAPPLTCPGWLCRTRVFTERGEQAWAGKRHTRSRMAVPSTPLLQRLDSLWRQALRGQHPSSTSPTRPSELVDGTVLAYDTTAVVPDAARTRAFSDPTLPGPGSSSRKSADVSWKGGCTWRGDMGGLDPADVCKVPAGPEEREKG